MGSRRTWVGVLAAIGVVGLFCGILIWRGVANRDIQFTNCTQTEAIKTELRKQAREDYRNLNKGADLLGIKVTKKLRDAAAANRDNTLRHFKRIDCKHLVS